MDDEATDTSINMEKANDFLKDITINEKGLGFYHKPQNKKIFYSFGLNKKYESYLFNSEYLAKKLYKGFLVWQKGEAES